MICRTVTTSGVTAIVCGPRPRAKRCGGCGRPAKLLCDWKLDEGKTCDEPICASCATEVAADKHLCPTHLAAYGQWLTARGMA
jgi:hypothetical protein